MKRILDHRLTPDQFQRGIRSDNTAVARTISQRYESMLDEIVGMDYSTANKLLESLGWIVLKYDPNSVFGGGSSPENVIELIVFEGKIVPYNLENIKRSQDESDTEE